MQEHLTGKQHVAWDKIRNKLAELRAMNSGKGPPSATKRREPVRERSKEKERDAGRDRERSKERERRDR